MRKILFIIPVLILISACSTRKEIIEVPVETVRTEYVHNRDVDSVYILDSISRWATNDTVYVNKVYTKYKYKFRTDTVVKTDTISNIIEVKTTEIKEVNKIKWY